MPGLSRRLSPGEITLAGQPPPPQRPGRSGVSRRGEHGLARPQDEDSVPPSGAARPGRHRPAAGVGLRPESCGKDSSWRSPLKSELEQHCEDRGTEGASVTIVSWAWALLDQELS